MRIFCILRLCLNQAAVNGRVVAAFHILHSWCHIQRLLSVTFANDRSESGSENCER
ncbi:hypothetical protein O6H91_01G144500 [Diphasiastrum complanatum]|uniref:Uncharacterized protein n=1 Tax=Diphasiastrum complanatum TaxID=34168 RepID=A0ACC2EWV2_DIPCM|nr:hypothetical protein O6H91_01G144500 [Diphasiastrum complanatum]